MSSAEEAGCFTLTWEIENYSLLLGQAEAGLRSPAWKTDTTEGSAWWRLKAYHSVSDVMFELFRLTGSWDLDRCKLFLITSCGEVPLKVNSNLTFSIERNSVFGDNSKSILPNDTLTLYCRMWKKTMKIGECRQHSVLRKVNFTWDNEKVNLDTRYYTFIEKNNFLLCIYVNKKSAKGTYMVIVGAVPERDSCVSFVDCKLFLIDGLGRVSNKECIYPFVSWRCDIKNFVEKNENSGLQFQLEFIVAVHKDHIPQFFSSKCGKDAVTTVAVLDSSGTLSNDLLHIYRGETFSDATLITEGKSFSTHRSILAARSPVFRAMFEKEQLSEGRSGVVNIEDVDSATLDRMLVFLYGDSLEKVNWEEASALYYAADKYAILSLKEKCADILKAGLALDNACDALVLADKHSDQELMMCTVDFIRDHQEVISSAEWEKLEASNYILAAKSLREVIVKKGKK